MKLSIISPAKALNKAYLKQSLKRDQIELFKASYFSLYMEQLPIPPATDAQQSPLIELVQKILAAKNVGASPCGCPPFGADCNKGDRKGTPLQELQTADISTLEAEIDRLVYELYGLTEDEIAVAEGKS